MLYEMGRLVIVAPFSRSDELCLSAISGQTLVSKSVFTAHSTVHIIASLKCNNCFKCKV